MASHRRTAFAALAVVLASLSLYAVFIGSTWFWAGCGSIIVVALTGTATRLRRLPVPVVTLAGVAALFLYLNVTFSNTRSFARLLPTPASVVALWHIAGQGFNESAKYAPPVPGLRGMALLAAAGIGIAALLTDLIAVRLGSAALAGLPLLLLVIEPFTLSVSRGWLGTAVTFCLTVAGYLALLSSEARDRIREWEHPDPAGSRELAPDTRPLAATGRRVGFASVVVALCLPLIIPGVHTTRLFGGGQPGIGGKATHGDGSGSGSGPGSAVEGFPDPNTTLSKELTASKNSTVLVYKTSDPLPNYLQIYTLDKLTSDKAFQLFNQPLSQVQVSPRMPAPPGLTSKAGVTTISTRVIVGPSVGQDPLGALPVPYPATAVTTTKGTLRADRSTLMVFASGVALGGLGYTVTSLEEDPTSAALDNAPAAPSDIAAPYLQVPSDYDSLRGDAESIVRQAGAANQFEEAIALQNWFAVNGQFTYTIHAPTALTADALQKFLIAKKGYCQQFSFAMAVFARLLGIPARIAYGFTSGTSIGDDEWAVTAHDAHAWPELYFQGYGWLRFEPTPSGSAGQASATTPNYAFQLTPGSTASATPKPTSGAGTQAGKLPVDVNNLRQRLGDEPGGNPGTTGGTSASKAGGVSLWEVLGLVVAGLLLIALIAPWCARIAIRRRRWRRWGGDPDTPGARDIAWAHAAWLELRDDLVDYGAGYQPSETPRAVAARADAGLTLTSPAQTALGRIALAEEKARYAPEPTDGAQLRADSAAVRRAIAAAVPRRARWRARLLPPSVVSPVLTTLAAASNGQYWRDRFRPPGRFRRRAS